MKIALFGGAFDPPHLGHRQLLKEVLKLKFFDQIWLIPTFMPPLKINNSRDGSVASPEDRLEMCRILSQKLKVKSQKLRIRVLDLEIKREGKSYTIETVRELKRTYPENKFFFLIGSDWVKDLPRWHKAKELFNEIEFLSLPRTKISSSEIREKIKNGQSIKDLVSKKVEQYIIRHHLYE